MRKKKRDSKKTKAKLLQTAEKYFVEKGFDGARVDKIALEAGINKRMIYVFFGSKENLYYEVLRNSFKKLFQSDRPEPAPGGDPVSDSKALIGWYFWFLSDNPNFVRLLGWETMNDGKRAAEVLIELMGEGLGPLQKMIKRGKSRGFIRKDVAVHKLVTMIHEMCLGFFSRRDLLEVLWGQDLSLRENQEEMLEQMIGMIHEGMIEKSFIETSSSEGSELDEGCESVQTGTWYEFENWSRVTKLPEF